MLRCGIVILAAGGSTRLGFAKQLVELNGTSLLSRITGEAVASVCNPVVVVLGSRAEQIRPAIDGMPVVVIVNEHWETGMGSSIRCGVAALLNKEPDLDAILLALCDQPKITAAVLDLLVSTQSASAKSVTAAEYAGTLGTPAVFSEAIFPELLALPDAAGGRSIINRHQPEITRLPVPEAEFDLDTAEDLKRMKDHSSDRSNGSGPAEPSKPS